MLTTTPASKSRWRSSRLVGALTLTIVASASCSRGADALMMAWTNVSAGFVDVDQGVGNSITGDLLRHCNFGT